MSRYLRVSRHKCWHRPWGWSDRIEGLAFLVLSSDLRRKLSTANTIWVDILKTVLPTHPKREGAHTDPRTTWAPEGVPWHICSGCDWKENPALVWIGLSDSINGRKTRRNRGGWRRHWIRAIRIAASKSRSSMISWMAVVLWRHRGNDIVSVAAICVAAICATAHLIFLLGRTRLAV